MTDRLYVIRVYRYNVLYQQYRTTESLNGVINNDTPNGGDHAYFISASFLSFLLQQVFIISCSIFYSYMIVFLVIFPV